MNDFSENPWATGPGEMLQHGLQLLRKDSDTNRRLALILIDNSVELMIKTYLTLPTRITGLSISRKQKETFVNSFPNLLSALEENAKDKVRGVNLGHIEWFHRLRNTLYHEGNGITIEKTKVVTYANIADQLFENLYGSRLVENISNNPEVTAEFLSYWSILDEYYHFKVTRKDYVDHQKGKLDEDLFGLAEEVQVHGWVLDVLDQSEIEDISSINDIKNNLVLGTQDYETEEVCHIIERMKIYISKLKKHKESS